MKVYRSLEQFKKLDNAIVTQGTFDGVHSAHQVILSQIKKIAAQKNGQTVVITYDPHPRTVLFPEDHGLQLLNTTEEKIELIREQGIDHLIILPFTKDFSRLSSLEFIRDILVNKIGTKYLVIGYNHRFGKNREGSFAHLKEFAPTYGFEISEISAQDVDEISVSSTKIREALNKGDVTFAAKLLGSPYLLSGEVIAGKQLGRTIGYPTANIKVSNPLKLIPADGVYAVWVGLNQQRFGGMLNIGNNPTIEGKGRSIEVNIFDFSETIYNQTISIQFVDKLRNEEKFNGLESLKSQLHNDKLQALSCLGMATKSYAMRIKLFLFISIFIWSINANQANAQVVTSPDSLDTFEEVEENEEDESAEYDSVVVSGSDKYWDFVRPRNFLFDTAFAPATTFYKSWDTITINPYKKDLRNMEDTIRLVLANFDDCSFHPPAIGDVTSNFGFRNWGRRQKFHFGTDIRMEVGDPVYAAFEGVVRIAKKSADYGYVVLIRHNNGLETLYAHFSQLLAYPGEPVKGGNIIGLAGSTGRSTGPHLHFEVRFQGEKIDPAALIHFPSGSLMNDTFQVDKGCFKHLYDVQSAKLKAAKKAKTPKYIKARKNDTLTKIANRYGISVKKLSKLNGLKANTKIKSGRNIRLR